MTTYTESELAARVLKDLGLLGSDESPTAEDLADTIETCASEIQQMETRGIAVWGGNEQSVPTQYLTALSRRIGLAVGPSFGMFSVAEATAAIMPAEQLLRQLSAQEPTGVPMTAEHF